MLIWHGHNKHGFKAQFIQYLSITEAEPNLPDAYKKKGVQT